MNKLACKVRNYLGDDSAVDREVGMILGVVFVVGISIGIGYFAWNLIAGKHKQLLIYQINQTQDLETNLAEVHLVIKS